MKASPDRRRSRWVGAALIGCGLWAACAAPPSDDALLDRWRGENAVAQGRFDWARQYFRADVERHPEHLPSLRQEGISWLSGYQQSLSTGVEILTRYLELHGEDEEIEQRVVQVLLMLGEKDALARWVDSLDTSPEGQRLRAEVFLRESPERAVAAIEDALAAAPNHTAVHQTAARLYEHLEDADKVVLHARRALELDPFDFRSAYLLGRWTQRLGDRPMARRWLELHQQLRRLQADGTMAPLAPHDALQLMADVEPQLLAISFPWRKRRLQLLFESGDLANAEALLDTLATSPDISPSDVLEMATWAGDGGRRGLAQRLFERILEQEPAHPGALASLALLAIEQGDGAQARRLLASGLDGRPHFARFHFLAGRVAILEDREQDARRDLERAIELAPWEWSWRVVLCDLLLALGDHETFRQVLQGAPEEPPGWLAYRLQHEDP